MKNSLRWNASDTPVELRTILKTLAENTPLLTSNEDGIPLSFFKSDEKGLCESIRTAKEYQIAYNQPAQAARALGAIISGLVKKGKGISESTPFETFGIMLDCSRNAVMTPEHMKVWLRRLCLLGYNMVMLYTEDTYSIPGEPYFGFQRGAYSSAEIKSINAYAKKLGIEIIPCIQTLGHLEHILKHSAYWKVKDTARVLLVGEDETYELIEKMIAFWSKSCASDRIHIGMDETHDLGLGRYLDLNGYKNGFELFNEHLQKVTEICRRYNLKPMIWSDMYFRLGCKSRGYYDKSTVIPAKVKKQIPEDAELVYWDYYHKDKEFYEDWIERHRKLGKEPLMGSGIWTWKKYWHDWRSTETTAGPCIDACYDSKLKEVFFTQWGDNGAFCDHDSAFAGMTYCAEKAYGHKETDEATLEKRFAAVCGGSYKAHILAGDIHGCVEGLEPDMWDDPLFDTNFRTWAKGSTKKMSSAAESYKNLARRLKSKIIPDSAGDMKHAYQTAKAFAARYTMTAELLSAYRAGDLKKLKQLKKKVPGVVKEITEMELTFRTMWLSHNKPEGLEVIQGRFGMLEARYRELMRSIDEYTSGKSDKIVELATVIPPK